MTASELPSNPGTRLPSGRHGLTREEVMASQRARLVDAMVHVVADKGYAATTVADVVERAGVSRRTFYEQFADKEACFLAAYDVALAAVLGRIAETAGPEGPDGPAAGWRAPARAGVEGFLDLLAGEPAHARALQGEILPAGPAPPQRRAGMLATVNALGPGPHRPAPAPDPRP